MGRSGPTRARRAASTAPSGSFSTAQIIAPCIARYTPSSAPAAAMPSRMRAIASWKKASSTWPPAPPLVQ